MNNNPSILIEFSKDTLAVKNILFNACTDEECRRLKEILNIGISSKGPSPCKE